MLLNNFNIAFSYGNVMPKTMNNITSVYTTSLDKLSQSNSNCHYCATGSNACYVMIGAGTTTPTKDDYDMADTSIIGDNKMKSITQTGVYSDATGASITTQWRNESSEAITVKEVGLVYKTNSMAYDKTCNVLLSRKVLDNPITIQPRETYIFTYNIKI